MLGLRQKEKLASCGLWLSGATAQRGVPLRIHAGLAAKDMLKSSSEVIPVIPLLEKSDIRERFSDGASIPFGPQMFVRIR